jgi:hypothetical protein
MRTRTSVPGIQNPPPLMQNIFQFLLYPSNLLILVHALVVARYP